VSDQKIILNDSPDAAQIKTVTGWVDSKTGHFWGEDERQARYSGCTHIRCECGVIYERGHGIRCSACQKNVDVETFNSYPVEKWDGQTPVVLYNTDRFFFGEDILDLVADSDPAKDDELRICKCYPHYLSLISDDNWCDDLASDGDGELPGEVQKAVDALNEAIKAAGPVSWFEDKIAIDVADLRARVSTYSATHMSAHD
jgi:hypothetical protein